MKCVMCNNNTSLKHRKINLKYKDCGLDNVTIHGVIMHHCNACGEDYLSIGNLDSLHAAIAEYLLTTAYKLSGKEVRFLRTFLGYSTDLFAKLTGYDPATVSRIENGKQEASLSFNILVKSLAANKLPDRNYDLHDLWLKGKRPAVKHIDLKLSGKQWVPIKKAA